jgi:hypothetical protein
MTVTLKNNTARAIPIVLDHPAFRNRASGFRRRPQTTIVQARNGARTTKIVQREEQGSITLPARGEVHGLHPAIKNCAQVRGLLARKAVAIKPDAPPTQLEPAVKKRAGKRAAEKGAEG